MNGNGMSPKRGLECSMIGQSLDDCRLRGKLTNNTISFECVAFVGKIPGGFIWVPVGFELPNAISYIDTTKVLERQ